VRLFKSSSRSLVCFAFAGLLSVTSAIALTLDEVPTAVRKTIEKDAKGGAVLSIVESTEGDKKIFTATIAENGGENVIVIGEHGRLLHRTHRSTIVREAKKGAHEAKKEEKELKKEKKGAEKPTNTDTSTPSNSAPAAVGKAK
jgi:hypothetical protein